MLFLPTPLFSVAFPSWIEAPESLDPSSQYSGLKCWQVSPFCPCCREDHCTPSLSLSENEHSDPQVCLPGCFQVTFIQPAGCAPGHWVFALDTFRCTMWHSLWARAWASPAPLTLYKQALDREANVAILELQEIYAVTLSNKNTQGEHFSCCFFMERRKASCKGRHWINHLHGVLVTIPLNLLEVKDCNSL